MVVVYGRKNIGTVGKEAQEVYYLLIGSNGSSRRWAHQGLIQQLLSKVHHKMWIARNVMVHETSG